MMSEKSKKDWKKFKEENDSFDELENEGAPESAAEIDKMGSALEHLSYLELEEKLTLAEQQVHENWEKTVRATAELDNVRRRSEQEVAKVRRYSLEKFITSLLPVVDSLEQALQLADKSGDTSMHEGLELTMKLVIDVLRKHDVQQLDPQGAVFDPQQHEAMSILESADVPPNTILSVFQKGYTLSGDRVIRPARVIVSKAKP